MLTRLALIMILTIAPFTTIGCNATDQHRMETHETTNTVERSEPQIVVE